jgi:predicted DNA-binding WGR domain protein
MENTSPGHSKFYEMIQETEFGKIEARWGRIGKANLSSKLYFSSEWHQKLIEKRNKGYKVVTATQDEKIINNIIKFNKLIDAVHEKGNSSELEYVLSYKLRYVVVDSVSILKDAKIRMNEIWKKYKPKEEQSVD